MSDFLDAPRTFVRVYELPDRLVAGYCHGGGVPVVFKNVDWFEAVVSEGREALEEFIREKRYFRPGRAYLVLADDPGLTFTIGEIKR